MIDKECIEEKILLPSSISATHENKRKNKEEIKETIKQYFS